MNKKLEVSSEKNVIPPFAWRGSVPLGAHPLSGFAENVSLKKSCSESAFFFRNS